MLIIVTGILRRRFATASNPWLWRALHGTAYLCWPLAVLHGLLAGRLAKPYVDWSYGACLAAAGLALTMRFVATIRTRDTAAQPVSDQPASRVVCGARGARPAHRLACPARQHRRARGRPRRRCGAGRPSPAAARRGPAARAGGAARTHPGMADLAAERGVAAAAGVAHRATAGRRLAHRAPGSASAHRAASG